MNAKETLVDMCLDDITKCISHLDNLKCWVGRTGIDREILEHQREKLEQIREDLKSLRNQ